MRVRVNRGMPVGAVELVESLEPLFAPAPVRLSRVGTRDGASTAWSVVPSLRRPIVLVPAANRDAAVAFRPSRAGSGGRKMRALAFLQHTGLLRLLPLPKVVVERSRVEDLLGVVREVVGDADDLVVRLGRRRFNRAVVLVVLGRSGDIGAFVKVARSAEGQAALELEYRNLLAMVERPVTGLRPPQPLGYWRSGGVDFLALEPLLSDEVHPPRPLPVAQMLRLAGRAPSPGPEGAAAPAMVDSDYVRRLRARVEELTDPEQRAWVVRALDKIVEKHGQVPLPMGPWHGDWVPWNMVRRGDEVLLWDWEHFTADVPCGFDHVHYLAQDIRTEIGTDAAAEDRWVVEASSELDRDWALSPAQIEAVLRLYLIEVNVRYLQDRQDDPLGTPPRAGWSVDLLARLDPDTTWSHVA